MSDVIENFKIALKAAKISGKVGGILLALKVIDKLNREYSQENVAPSSDHILGATQQAMVIGETLRDLSNELKKELELLPELKGVN